MREENFWCKKPRYSEVRVITRRVIARYDVLQNHTVQPVVGCQMSSYLTTYLMSVSVMTCPVNFKDYHFISLFHVSVQTKYRLT